MRTAHMTEHDLWEDLRRKSRSALKQVGDARLERNGNLSVVTAKLERKVVEVQVQDGEHMVRIAIKG